MEIEPWWYELKEIDGVKPRYKLAPLLRRERMACSTALQSGDPMQIARMIEYVEETKILESEGIENLSEVTRDIAAELIFNEVVRKSFLSLDDKKK